MSGQLILHIITLKILRINQLYLVRCGHCMHFFPFLSSLGYVQIVYIFPYLTWTLDQVVLGYFSACKETTVGVAHGPYFYVLNRNLIFRSLLAI